MHLLKSQMSHVLQHYIWFRITQLHWLDFKAISSYKNTLYLYHVFFVCAFKHYPYMSFSSPGSRQWTWNKVHYAGLCCVHQCKGLKANLPRSQTLSKPYVLCTPQMGRVVCRSILNGLLIGNKQLRKVRLSLSYQCKQQRYSHFVSCSPFVTSLQLLV